MLRNYPSRALAGYKSAEFNPLVPQYNTNLIQAISFCKKVEKEPS